MPNPLTPQPPEPAQRLFGEMEVRSAEVLLHELQVHQVELEMQNETLRQAQVAMEESRDRYVDLYDFAPVGYATLSSDGIIEQLNLTAAALLGEERVKLIGRRFASFVAAEGRDCWYLHLQRKTGQPGSCEIALRPMTGDVRHIQAECLRVVADGGSSTLRIAFTDITKRKQAEQQRRESEQLFRALFENSMDAILLTTCEGRILAANTQAQQLFGRSEDELCRLGRQCVVDPGDHRLLPALTQCEEQGEFRGELTFVARDGRKLPVEIASSMFVGKDGQRMSHILVRDLTEVRRTESKLAALGGEMRQLLEWQVARHTVSALAHELNQPLSSISALCEAVNRMLAADGASALSFERLEQGVQRLAFESERAGGVARRLLESLRSPADTSWEPLSLAGVLHEAVRLARASGYVDFQVAVDCPDDLPAVQGNRLQVEKILLNLIGNSTEAMRQASLSRGQINIRAGMAAEGSGVCVTVSDEGPGVGHAMASQVFHPFVTTKPRGMGMGLTICRALAEAQGGKLWFEAQAGPGATFHFTLPLAR